MKKILIVTLLSLALVAGYAVDQAPVSSERKSTSQFMIGMLRADGTLVPFAQYGNGGWWNPWPKPRDVAESIYAESNEVMPNSLADLSEPWFNQCGTIPTLWFFWSSAGTSTELRASKLVRVRAHSGTNWGLLTDLPQRTSQDPLHDIIGVAVTVRQKIEPFIKTETASTQGKEINSFIKQIFDVEETAEIDRMREETPPAIANSSSFPFSLSSEDRAKVEASLTVLYGSSSVVNGKHVYYFEAEKQYQTRTASDPGCYDVSLFQGWISTDEKGGMGLMAGNFVFTDCDRKGPSTMIPVGIITLKDQVFLFVREHGWEDESYTILELNQSRLQRVLQTVGA
jgi:hypothetical protein